MKAFAILFLSVQLMTGSYAHTPTDTIRIDGSRKFQHLEGLGVNINTAWWYKGDYRDSRVVQPAIDLLVDSLGATLFRAVIEEIDWEAVNDNDDPDQFNWDYYNQVFSGPRFQGVWKTLRYLNHKGIVDGLMLSFMGAPPAAAPLTPKDKQKSWMGNTDYSISPDKEDEFVETLAAFLYYARNTAKIRFSLVSPMNETDVVSYSKNEEHPNGIVEGPNIPDAVQFARIVKKLGKKLDAIGMSDIRFVAPDASTDRLFSDCLSTMIKDPYLMGKLAHWGVHQYGSSAQNYMNIVVNPSNPNHSYWVTETAGIGNMLGQLADSAQAYIFWDGFDCVYQHARRNGYGDNPPNDWVFWEGPDAGKPLIAYDSATGDWKPRKQFYQFAQLYEFVKPGAVRIGSTCDGNNMVIRAFLNPDNQLVIVGRNAGKNPVHLAGIMDNLPEIQQLKLLYTTAAENCHAGKDIKITGGQWSATLPADCIFTLNGSPDPKLKNTKIIRPEPDDWFAGDMHVHRNCGADRPILPESEFINRMKTNNLAVISVLADMGDAEVQNSRLDLPKVDGMDAPQSEPGRIVHYDAEWHFDPEGVTFDHKAIGGHLVLLGLQEAHQIWDESPYKIVQWAKAQGALAGFCHMEYLNDSIPKELSCCIPLDYPVETALGTIDFLAEDVWLNDAAIHAYYRLLNCGFRPGWAAGTDYPCNENRPLGSLMTYVQVKNPPLTYRKWIDGIREGRTVVTTDGHAEFLDLKVDGDKGPGDDIRVKQGGNIPVVVTWTADSVMTGRMEVVCNGKVVASQTATALPGKPVILKATVHCENSSWICARRMDDTGHRSHTAAVFLTVNNRPVRASAADAEYFVQWINNLLAKTAPGGPWNGYFTQDLQGVQARYQQARTLFEKIEKEAKDTP